MNKRIELLRGKLIVSCQAPVNSPIHSDEVISAIAFACVKQGAAGVRIDTPSHIKEVRKTIGDIPIIGLWKKQYPKSAVYITPTFSEAEAISEAGADIIAIDGTTRMRPEQEKLESLIAKIHDKLGKLVMADVDTQENAIASVKAGADIVGTTLYGYTEQTRHLLPPGFELLTELVNNLQIPIICEGGIANPEQANHALKLGAYAVVVGNAITGIDEKVKNFLGAINS